MDDESILCRIDALVSREHELRTSRQQGTLEEHP
jgi:hypothetical protein